MRTSLSVFTIVIILVLSLTLFTKYCIIITIIKFILRFRSGGVLSWREKFSNIKHAKATSSIGMLWHEGKGGRVMATSARDLPIIRTKKRF